MTLRLEPPEDGDLAAWWRLALGARAAGLRPDQVIWQAPETADLFAAPVTVVPSPLLPSPVAPDEALIPLSEAATHLIETVVLHSSETRFALAYRLLDRLAARPALIGNPADPDIRRAQGLAKAVHRDMHKMKAFVRFRSVATPQGERFIAWFEPDHHILEATAPFFRRRFAAMHWAILTPRKSAFWDGKTLSFGLGARREDAPTEDAMETAWTAYYAAIFNPARLKPDAMRAEMPKKYWRNLPEAKLIPGLIETAAARTGEMIASGPTTPNRRIVPYQPQTKTRPS
ncbi:MAG: TIGR03915 family putative DNA repair protein [Proteobacteria bacterium]|nr:TIGR03915 family putative DNA repair protein [Pseudomonadota bacterium]